MLYLEKLDIYTKVSSLGKISPTCKAVEAGSSSNVRDTTHLNNENPAGTLKDGKSENFLGSRYYISLLNSDAILE